MRSDEVSAMPTTSPLEHTRFAETENARHASLPPDQKVEVDLRQLTGVDNAGRDLPAAIQRSGACLIVEGVWMTALIGELNSPEPREDARPQAPTKKRPGRAIPRKQESSR
jgi:hypothetical protein